MDIQYSFIIPVYNVEQYLQECVESIIKQNTDNIEIILVDDGSFDNSGNLCDEYEKSVSYIKAIHQKNQGLSGARNTGLRHAKGKYVIFIDSDDYVDNHMVQNVEQILKQNGTVDVVLPIGWYKVYLKKTVLEDVFDIRDMHTVISGTDALRIYLKQNVSGWTACGKVFNRDFLLKNGFQFKQGIYYEDAQTIYKIIAKAESVSYVPASYFYRKNRETSILGRVTLKRVLDYIDILKEWDEYLEEMHFEQDITTGIRAVYAMEYVSSILPSIPRLEKQDRKYAFKKARQIDCYLEYSSKRLVKITRQIKRMIGFHVSCYILCVMKEIKRIIT